MDAVAREQESAEVGPGADAGRKGGFGDYRGLEGPACLGVGVDKGNPGGRTLAWEDSRGGSYGVAGWAGKVGSLLGAWGHPV